ncbi:hypothetical protein HZS38_14010 [Xenorhabdus nematophila]|nr:hypothetical protein [Xenorhabdus nematophila]AYA41468.1 hypothetical protein D3790_14295 [Xenorhabdus nematophila]KHD27334.1 hypothetical protein LH67_19060 [Xenorhabdus nematophila]MBA0020206.1 hypothetical protein [Xenorhabdus nematophila]MCB4426957.1 hypothetical protein [Xenorhabdus nematophila]QNJ35855.1 hypothetical protein H8F46_14015 [Xenorhabdus nematophila]
MSGSTNIQKAERLNMAHGLLTHGLSVAEAALSLSRQFELSRRQAYRYVEEAKKLNRPMPAVEPTAAVTFKLPPGLVASVRSRALAEGMTISKLVAQALRVFIGEANGNE